MRCWTTDEDRRLTALWAQCNPRLSCNGIAAAMGRTKNMVVGRAHRLKLPARPSPILERAAYPALQPKARAARKPAQARSPRLPPRWASGAGGLARAQAMASARVAAPEHEISAAETPREYGAEAGGGHSPFAVARHPIPAPAGDPRDPSSPVSARNLAPVVPPAGAAGVFPGMKTCRWPLWADDARPDHRFCGEAAMRGAYCAAHGARAYTEAVGPSPARQVTRSPFACGGVAA
jgi:GcrA cell cycle regulator